MNDRCSEGLNQRILLCIVYAVATAMYAQFQFEHTRCRNEKKLNVYFSRVYK